MVNKLMIINLPCFAPLKESVKITDFNPRNAFLSLSPKISVLKVEGI